MPKIKGKTLGKLTMLTLTEDQAIQAKGYGAINETDGGYQRTFREITATVKKIDGAEIAHVYDTVLDKIRAYAKRTDGGSYQDWCREVLTANAIGW